MTTRTIIAILFLVATNIVAQTLEGPFFPFPEPGTVSRQYPKLTTSPTGRIALTYVERSGNKAMVYVIASDDGGTSWSTPRHVTAVTYGTIGLQRQPYVVIDETNVWHAVWEDLITANQLDPFYSRSTDEGMTWSTPVSVAADSNKATQDFAAITAVNGNVYISFLDSRETFIDGFKHVYLARSTDNGTTWQAPVRVDQYGHTGGGVCECCQTNLTVDPFGTVYVAFRSNIFNRRDIHVARSTDGGQTFQQPIAVQDSPWHLDACPSTGPMLRSDASGTIHFAWADARDTAGYDAIYYTRLGRNETQPERNIQISPRDINGPNWPSIAVSGDADTVGIVYQSFDGVRYVRSLDRSDVFTTFVVDEAPSRQEFTSIVRTRDGRNLVGWQGTREAVYDAFLIRDGIPSTSVDDDGTIDHGMWAYDVVDMLGRTLTSGTCQSEFVRMPSALLHGLTSSHHGPAGIVFRNGSRIRTAWVLVP